MVYILQELRHKSCFTCFLHFPLRFGIAVKLWAKDAQLPLGQRHSVEVPFWPLPKTVECLYELFESSGSRDSWAKQPCIWHMRPHWRFSLVTSQLWGVAPKMAICLRTMARKHCLKHADKVWGVQKDTSEVRVKQTIRSRAHIGVFFWARCY